MTFFGADLIDSNGGIDLWIAVFDGWMKPCLALWVWSERGEERGLFQSDKFLPFRLLALFRIEMFRKVVSRSGSSGARLLATTVVCFGMATGEGNDKVNRERGRLHAWVHTVYNTRRLVLDDGALGSRAGNKVRPKGGSGLSDEHLERAVSWWQGETQLKRRHLRR